MYKTIPDHTMYVIIVARYKYNTCWEKYRLEIDKLVILNNYSQILEEKKTFNLILTESESNKNSLIIERVIINNKKILIIV